MKEFILETSDKYPIAVTSFGENNATNKIIVISSAIGVKQTFYAKYATYLANKGYLIFTYDYRGIGESKPDKMKDFHAHFIDWADKDFLSLTQYIEEFYPSHEKYLIGHSIGGIMIGLTQAYRAYDKIITIGSQFGYIKNFHQKDKPKVNFFFRIAIPVLSSIYGFFPSQKVGMGEPIPRGIASDWKKLITKEQSILGYAEETQNLYDEITKPILIISLDDDFMATPKSVDLFAKIVLKNAKKKRLNIIPREYGLTKIGHLDFFREKYKNELWKIPLEYIEE
ncbi:alpha/beta fold hydrolase [Empedobacter tilapiae]|uniref:alpha/beta hydrolase family protein n=1 Tax=Empedobacter tilapiae TaxID=2491114 RepID=UPI0028D34E8A|nr:alpha/beta fold hydrolase [Empedobacter tilapiae]